MRVIKDKDGSGGPPARSTTSASSPSPRSARFSASAAPPSTEPWDRTRPRRAGPRGRHAARARPRAVLSTTSGRRTGTSTSPTRSAARTWAGSWPRPPTSMARPTGRAGWTGCCSSRSTAPSPRPAPPARTNWPPSCWPPTGAAMATMTARLLAVGPRVRGLAGGGRRREAPRGVSWRWVSLRPGRMAIVDRTNPWPAVVALAGLLVAGCSAASDAAGRLHPGPAASAAAVVSSPAAPVAQDRPTSPTPTPNGRVSSDRRLVLERTITGAIRHPTVLSRQVDLGCSAGRSVVERLAG
jgi:hypothetical protein